MRLVDIPGLSKRCLNLRQRYYKGDIIYVSPSAGRIPGWWQVVQPGIYLVTEVEPFEGELSSVRFITLRGRLKIRLS